MKCTPSRCRPCPPTALVCLLLATTAVSAEPSSWPQWGGPERDFQVTGAELAGWGEDGPKVLWRRELGDGNSAIAVVGDRLFTMYRKDDREHVTALDRRTGATVWVHSWAARPIWETFYADFGYGPHVTPLVADGRLYAAGMAGRLVCLDAADGSEIWSRELWQGVDLASRKFGPLQLGYAASPLLHDGRLIVIGGSPEAAVLALDPATGASLWTASGLEPAFASPIVIDLDGSEQIVVFVADEIAGLDPATGAVLWRAEHETDYYVNASTPIWDGDDTLFVSSAYGSGSRALRLRRTEEGVEVDELWASRQVQVHHQSAVLIDGTVYASSGDFGPAFLKTVRLADGEVLSQERGFAKANLIAAGERLVILDEDGDLALATATPEGPKIEARAKVFESRSWTVPTLVGSTLYARDREEIVAFDLGG